MTPKPLAHIGILWTRRPPEQRPRLPWPGKATGRHGSRIQARRIRDGRG